MEESKIIDIKAGADLCEESEEKKSEVITFSDSTFELLMNISREMKNMQDKVDLVISTVIAEKGNPTLKYSLAPDYKSLLPRKDERDS